MKVIYELSLEDMRRLIAEKYAVDISKIEIIGYDEQLLARVDMSSTETPGTNEPVAVLKVQTEDKPAQAVQEDAQKENKPIQIAQKRQFYKPSGYKFRSDVVVYDDLTDTDISDMVGSSVTVAEVCSVYGFDQQIKYRLYKRFEKARLELARHSNG